MAFKFFRNFGKRVSSATQKFWGKLGQVFRSGALSDANLEPLEAVLYGADFGRRTTEEILDEVRRAFAKNRHLDPADLESLVRQLLVDSLAGSEGRLTDPCHRPEILCLIGVNGSGKTTTAAKLAFHLRQQGRIVLLGSCDTFRAAANEQLNEWAKKLGLDLVSSHRGADAAAVAFDAIAAAQARQADYLILDTAGRLHTKDLLLNELEKLARVVRRRVSAEQFHGWLVLDGSLGSNSFSQAQIFHEKIGLDGIVVTKFDGTGRCGVLVGIYRELKIPIFFLGSGERPEDLQVFDRDDYVNRLFD